MPVRIWILPKFYTCWKFSKIFDFFSQQCRFTLFYLFRQHDRCHNFVYSLLKTLEKVTFSFTFGWNEMDTDPDPAPDPDQQALYADPDPDRQNYANPTRSGSTTLNFDFFGTVQYCLPILSSGLCSANKCLCSARPNEHITHTLGNLKISAS